MQLLKDFSRLLKAHKIAAALGLAFSIFLLLNFAAYMHAYSMTHFCDGGTKTKNPEKLSLFEKAGVLALGVTIPKRATDATPEAMGLPFSVHRFRSDPDVELEAWYVPRTPSQGAVLMFHGYSACKSDLVEESREFHALGYETFLVDFRGSGGSSGRRTSDIRDFSPASLLQ